MSRHANHINQLITKIDYLRTQLLQKNNRYEFLKTYSELYDIENQNTDNYWNKLFKGLGGLSKQSPMTKDKISIISRQIPNKPIRILDLGIGQGFVEELLKKRKTRYKINGIDTSSASIKRAKLLFDGKFIHDDVLRVDKYFKKNSMDLILALELLEHISPSKLFALYKSIFEILKEDGEFILSIPVNEGLSLMNTNPSAHVRDYNFQIIEAELDSNGFIVKRGVHLYAFGKRYVLKKFISKFLANKWRPNSLIIIAKKNNFLLQ